MQPIQYFDFAVLIALGVYSLELVELIVASSFTFGRKAPFLVLKFFPALLKRTAVCWALCAGYFAFRFFS